MIPAFAFDAFDARVMARQSKSNVHLPAIVWLLEFARDANAAGKTDRAHWANAFATALGEAS